MIHHTQFTLDQFAPIAVYQKLKHYFSNDISFLFESAGQSEGNYSIVIIGARERLQYINNQTLYTDATGSVSKLEISPFEFLKSYYKGIDTTPYKKISKELQVGYVDGFIGYIGYDMVKVFEPHLIPSMTDLKDELETPDLDLVLPKMVAIYSHKNHRITLISTSQSLSEEFDAIKDDLRCNYSYIPLQPITDTDEGSFAFDKETFFDMVRKSKEKIRSGDVFQILMTNRYTRKIKVDPFSFYRILRTKNPSPDMFLMEYEDFSIVGSSPEVMVRLNDGELL
ncbi:MAG TPA: anthranilate synthase component I family protein, partial [Helicobacteraceae bacterium]|nr:anthranilate synthase component I family protein [Helicobacteraceae bacterium]